MAANNYIAAMGRSYTETIRHSSSAAAKIPE